MSSHHRPRSVARIIGTAAVLTALVLPGLLAAQTMPPGRRGAGRTQLEQRIRARFGQIVRDRLGLTDEQARQLGRVVQGFEGDRMRLAGDEEAVRQKVATLLTQDQPSEDEARQLLDRMSELREQEIRLARQEEDSLLTVLSPAQVLRFNLLREQMAARIRQLRRGEGPGGRGPWRGGVGGGVPPGGTMPDPGGFF